MKSAEEMIALALHIGATERYGVYTFSATQLRMLAAALAREAPAASAEPKPKPYRESDDGYGD